MSLTRRRTFVEFKANEQRSIGHWAGSSLAHPKGEWSVGGRKPSGLGHDPKGAK